MRRTSRLLILLLLSPGAPLAKPLNTTPTTLPETRDPCALFTEDASYYSQTLIMQLEHRRVDLRVPVEFFEDPWDRKNGFADTAQLFSVKIGSFLPVSRAETGRRNKQDIWNWMQFTLNDFVPLPELARRSADTFTPRPIPPIENYLRHPGPFGLVEIKPSRSEPSADTDDNIYLYETAVEGIQAVIECDKPQTVKFPGCNHSFRSSGLDVRLSYRRTELPNWQALQNDVTKFLTCATSSKS